MKLGELIAPSGKRAGAETAPVYSVTKHHGFVRSDKYFTKRVFSDDLSNYKLVQKGDFAYATIHLDEGSIGRAPESALISPMYTVFTVDDSRVDPGYLLRYMKSPIALQRYATLGRGTAERRKSISLDSLGRLDVPLPPLPEQRRIAAILDEADALRTKRRESLELLARLRSSLFIREFGVPVGGNTETIGSLASSTQYGTSAKATIDGELPVLRMGNITRDGRLDLGDLRYVDADGGGGGKYLVERGDVLFNRTNSAELVGKTAYYDRDEPLAFAGYLVRIRTHEPHDGPYIAAYLNSAHGKATLRGMAKSIVGMANINAKEVQRIRVPISTPEKKRGFAARLQEFDRQREALEVAATALDTLFASLQHRAFTGRL